MTITAELNADDLLKAIAAYVHAPYANRNVRVVESAIRRDPLRATVTLETLELTGDSDNEQRDSGGSPSPGWTFLPRPDDDGDDRGDDDDGDDDS